MKNPLNLDELHLEFPIREYFGENYISLLIYPYKEIKRPINVMKICMELNKNWNVDEVDLHKDSIIGCYNEGLEIKIDIRKAFIAYKIIKAFIHNTEILDPIAEMFREEEDVKKDILRTTYNVHRFRIIYLESVNNYFDLYKRNRHKS